ncbi:MAG: DnaJ domain-containing protein [Woeseiaceae bacterium]|nr:DnaJ domain-containing protein [Woeseiaceae bacterium]
MGIANEQDPNYYELLGVVRDAPLSEIRASYRRLMQQAGNHPDLGGDTRTAALLNRAYAVLKSPDQRRFYDVRLDILSRIAAGFVEDSEPEPQPAPMDPRSSCLFCEQPHHYILDNTDELCCVACGSPLRRVDRSRIDPGDARAVKRLGRNLNIRIYTHWNHAKGFGARTVDISPHGLRLTTQCDLQAGQRIRIAGQVLEAVGRVTHCARQSRGWRDMSVAGVSFLTLRILRPVGAFVSHRI